MFLVDRKFSVLFLNILHNQMFSGLLISLPSWKNSPTKKWLTGYVRLDLDEVDTCYHKTTRYCLVMASSQRRNCMIVHLLMTPSLQMMMRDLSLGQKIIRNG